MMPQRGKEEEQAVLRKHLTALANNFPALILLRQRKNYWQRILCVKTSKQIDRAHDADSTLMSNLPLQKTFVAVLLFGLGAEFSSG